MQRNTQNRTKITVPTFFDLDIIGAAGVILVFLGITGKAMFDWLVG
jgi:hypothetical protein